MTLFDEPGDWDAEYQECHVCRDWHPASAMVGPDACLACATTVMAGGAG